MINVNNYRGFRVKRCKKCRLTELTCICNYIKEIDSNIHFWIIMHEDEFSKPTNTGRLILDTIKNSRIFFWNRINPPQTLIHLLESNQYNTYLVFPSDREDLKQREVTFFSGDKPLVFIIIDGTWKQARKILRKSPYLDNLPILSLNSNKKSSYKLRRASNEGHLCTIEVATEILKLADDSEKAKKVENFFHLFTIHYESGKKHRKVNIEDIKYLLN